MKSQLVWSKKEVLNTEEILNEDTLCKYQAIVYKVPYTGSFSMGIFIIGLGKVLKDDGVCYCNDNKDGTCNIRVLRFIEELKIPKKSESLGERDTSKLIEGFL